jgi:hypothetical protein
MARQVTRGELRDYSITTGAVLDDDYMTIVLKNDARLTRDPEDRHSYLGIWVRGSWRILESAYPLRSQTALAVPETAIISISDIGNVRRSTPRGGEDEARIGDFSGKRVLGRTRLNEVRECHGAAYTVGTRRSAYKRVRDSQWICIDDGCYSGREFRAGFESIHGFSEQEIYAVGRNGEIWQYDGTHWHQRDSPTNAWLNQIVCAEDGFAYAVGARGTIVKGRNDRWGLLPGIAEGYEFWSVEDYEGRIFLTANTMLLLVLSDAGDVELIDFGDCPVPTSAYHLAKGAGSLYCFGSKDIRKYDGVEWEEILTL